MAPETPIFNTPLQRKPVHTLHSDRIAEGRYGSLLVDMANRFCRYTR